jgi:hypothetical protein
MRRLPPGTSFDVIGETVSGVWPDLGWPPTSLKLLRDLLVPIRYLFRGVSRRFTAPRKSRDRSRDQLAAGTRLGPRLGRRRTRRASTPATELFAQDAVLLLEVLEELELAAVHPAREHQQQELERRDRHLRKCYRIEFRVRAAPFLGGEPRFGVIGEQRTFGPPPRLRHAPARVRRVASTRVGGRG